MSDLPVCKWVVTWDWFHLSRYWLQWKLSGEIGSAPKQWTKKIEDGCRAVTLEAAKAAADLAGKEDMEIVRFRCKIHDHPIDNLFPPEDIHLRRPDEKYTIHY